MSDSEKKEILIIGNENEFIVKNVIAEMQRRGYKSTTCKATVNAVNEYGKGIQVYLLFVDSADAIKDLLVYLKDTAFDKRIEISLIGERLDLQDAVRYIQKENVNQIFERPVDAKRVSDGLEEAYEAAMTKSQRKRILIIDDDGEYLRRTERILHNHYKVYMANSGTSALMLLSKHKVDLILLDYVMPVLDGPKVLEALKSEPNTAEIPVIFLSGRTDAKSITTAMTLGSENYISKALAARDLVTAISDYFSKKDWEAANAI